MGRKDIIKTGLTESEVLELFKQASKDLFVVINQTPKGTFRRRRQAQFNKINIIIDRLERKANKWADDSIDKIYREAAAEQTDIMKEFAEDGFKFAFSGVNEEAIEILTTEAYANFGKTMVGLRSSAQKAVIDLASVQNEIISGAIQGQSFSKSTYEVKKNLKAQGFEVLRAKNGFGRRFSLQHYSNMLVRSQNVKAYNAGAKDRLLKSGRRFAEFPKIRPDIDGDDVCNVWEEKVIVDLLKDPLPPESTHPNCRHVIRAISFERLKKLSESHYKAAIAYYEKVYAEATN